MKVLHLAAHLLSVSGQSRSFHGAVANEGRSNKAQSEKTLLCFHLDLFDVSASGDLDIISCPSSKRHQTRCRIQNQITEPVLNVVCAASIPVYRLVYKKWEVGK